MKQVGYVYDFFDEEYVKFQHEALKNENLDTIVFEEKFKDNSFEKESVLDEILSVLSPGDHLIVYELQCLGKSIIQLGDFLEDIERRKIKLIILNKKLSIDGMSNELYSEMVIRIAQAEKNVIRERTERGLAVARREGRVGGRPRVSKETIERIKFLYESNSYTLREIATDCDVSLGTAYKYVQK